MFKLDIEDPDFLIGLQHLNNPATVYRIMRKHLIKRAYVYGMLWFPKKLKMDFIKIGRSCPNLGGKREKQVGERIVRQIAWVPGWKVEHVKSAHGSDFWHNITHFAMPKNKIPIDFNKNMLYVGVWDISNRMGNSDLISADEELSASCWAEGSLADQYKQVNNGILPDLNFIDPSKNKIYSKAHVSKKIFNIMFDEVDNNCRL